MEKITLKTQELLEQSLALYQDLIAILEQEKEHIIEMNLEGIWETTHKKNQVVQAIEQKNGTLASKGFKGMTTIEALPIPFQERSILKTAALAINTCKENVARLANKNKTYIRESLSMIDGIFSTLTQSPGHTQYGNSGGVIANQEKKHFICAEV